MAVFRVTGGTLSGTVMSGNYPDNALPGDQPGIDNSLPGNQPGIDNSLPRPPPGVFPPPTITNPIVPIPPGTSMPPGTIWPSPNPPVIDNTLPGQPARPDNTLPPGVDNTLPQPPPVVDNTLPGGQGGEITNPIAPRTFWMLCYCPALGWRYVVVDPSLRPGLPIPPAPAPKPVG